MPAVFLARSGRRCARLEISRCTGGPDIAPLGGPFVRSGIPFWICFVVSLWLQVDLVMAETPDRSRESRITSEIIDTILDGEPLTLQTVRGDAFLGIYTRTADARPRGAAIILHGRGFHPDWSEVVQPLRVGLTEFGWNTLSIQLPVLPNDAKYYDYVEIFDHAYPRIEAAIAKVDAEPAQKVVIIAHSCGAHMFQHWVGTSGRRALNLFDAYIGIGMGATDYGQKMREPFFLDRIKVPVLDIYGENDFPAVLRMAPERLDAMAAAGNPKSRQLKLPDSDHYFVNRGELLLNAVATWLETL